MTFLRMMEKEEKLSKGEETMDISNVIAEDVIAEDLTENTIETAEEAGTLDEALDVVYNDGEDGAVIAPEVVESVDGVVETEDPVVDPLPVEDTITAEEIQYETAEPQEAEVIEDIQEEADTGADPEDTPVIEEAVIPSYIAHAAEYGTRENPTIAPGGREVLRPSLLEQ